MAGPRHIPSIKRALILILVLEKGGEIKLVDPIPLFKKLTD